MSAVLKSGKAPAGFTDFKVADLALADWGRKEIAIAETTDKTIYPDCACVLSWNLPTLHQAAPARGCTMALMSSREPLLVKTSAARSSSCRFQSLIWFGCTSNFSHSSAMVRSSRNAASATCALNAGLRTRRLRRPDAFFFIRNSLSPGRSRPGSIPSVPTYPAVQISGDTSVIALQQLYPMEYNCP